MMKLVRGLSSTTGARVLALMANSWVATLSERTDPPAPRGPEAVRAAWSQRAPASQQEHPAADLDLRLLGMRDPLGAGGHPRSSLGSPTRRGRRGLFLRRGLLYLGLPLVQASRHTDVTEVELADEVAYGLCRTTLGHSPDGEGEAQLAAWMLFR